MAVARKLSEYLDSRHVSYDCVTHARSDTTMQAAKTSNVPAASIAKAVVVEDDRQRMVAVLPASRRLRLEELGGRLGHAMRLASEPELKHVFVDCAPGAVPPVGAAYGIETILDDSLMDQPDVYFEAGDHETLVHMKTRDFIGMMEGARHMTFSQPAEAERGGPLF